jgi:light-regulated signal transduction histidine kinase (bacteriophytochrome)
VERSVVDVAAKAFMHAGAQTDVLARRGLEAARSKIRRPSIMAEAKAASTIAPFGIVVALSCRARSSSRRARCAGVFNLVRNAVEAMAGGARRVITTVTALTSNNMVELSVADTGPGLSPDIRAKLFEPFITTKATGLGVGCRSTTLSLKAHCGQLRADDNPEAETVFQFTLPLPP